jgi:CheY-like chemotaxis protein
MESLGILAGGVAHDMNNVLGAILGLASVHLELLPPESPLHRALSTITKACTRGGNLIQSLLGFARQGLTEEKELDMNTLVRDEVRLLERTTLARVRLEMDLTENLRPILGDASALTHLLMNLCVNAVDAMPENGTLTLRTRNVDEAWIEIEVADTGTGMSTEVLEKALDPFFTTKAHGKGTGLGLSIAYSTVMAHRGQMELESEPGHGTRVKLRFPASASQLRNLEASPETQGAPTVTPLKVLLVDDDELIQSSMQAILEVLGHSVTSTRSGEEALAALEAGCAPDVVILDLNMPGLGGAGTLPRLRALRPTLPILLATGRADQTALDLIQAHPHVTLLSKPFSMKDLQKHLGPHIY